MSNAQIDLQKIADEVMRRGPDRVVINVDGEARPSRIAREQYGVCPDVIFIRNDGWTLGASSHLEATAKRLWRDQWVGIIRRPETKARPLPF